MQPINLRKKKYCLKKFNKFKKHQNNKLVPLQNLNI